MISLKSELYTVGWIAALPLELSAAVSLLDELHDAPTDWNQPKNDETDYTWGRIGDHNIILAALSQYGDTHAVAAAIRMRNSFSNILFGLMVGVGAGVSSAQNDIRLGDVVISKPGDSSGGVVKYDMIKHEEDKKGQRPRLIGTLNKPPEVLLQAVVKLQRKVEMFEIRIPSILASIDEKMRVEGGYRYQGAENDRLFKDARPHPEGQEDCSKCKRRWEKTRRIPDKDRSKGPQLFFGTIASGNTVVKSAKRRAEIVKLVGKDTMCIEMEAAGLMDVIPCLVIRGICDYADSHKNKRWQNYAAATAAATAKELLLGMNASHLEKTEKSSLGVEESRLH